MSYDVVFAGWREYKYPSNILVARVFDFNRSITIRRGFESGLIPSDRQLMRPL